MDEGKWTSKAKIEFPTKLRLLAARLGIGRKSFFQDKSHSLLVIGGAYVDFTAFPYNYFYEIVPVFWDTWPKYHPLLISSLKRNKIRYAFFTQKDVAILIQEAIPEIESFWLPEGIKTEEYRKGVDLIERQVDVLSYGRKLEKYHTMIVEVLRGKYNYLYSSHKLDKIFPNFQELVKALSNSKISVCFPRSVTDPHQAGDVETLTQRYWESMLSRCIIVGKAPQELIDLMGYNPVIEVDWLNPKQQITEILDTIENYQPLVNRNFRYAVDNCAWHDRMKTLFSILKEREFDV